MKKWAPLLTAVIAMSCVGTDFVVEPDTGSRKPVLRITTAVSAIMVDSTLQLSAEAQSADGHLIDNVLPQWRSSDSTIISTTGSGLVTGRMSGQSWVHAYLDGYESDSLLLSVVENQVSLASILVTPASGILGSGDSLQFSATGYDLSGNEIDSINFSWESSNPAVLPIDSNGLARAISAGTAAVTAYAENIQSQPVQVNVRDSLRTGIFASNPSNRYEVSGSARLSLSPTGELILQFSSDFQTDPGPGVYIYLTTAPQALTPDNFEVGPIISVTGAQTYTIPSSVDLFQYDYVLVHCKPFNVPFGSAKLE